MVRLALADASKLKQLNIIQLYCIHGPPCIARCFLTLQFNIIHLYCIHGPPCIARCCQTQTVQYLIQLDPWSHLNLLWERVANDSVLGSGMRESCQWLGVRQWYSLATLVSSTIHNWLVTVNYQHARKSDDEQNSIILYRPILIHCDSTFKRNHLKILCLTIRKCLRFRSTCDVHLNSEAGISIPKHTQRIKNPTSDENESSLQIWMCNMI